jgi:hypothetical protein
MIAKMEEGLGVAMTLTGERAKFGLGDGNKGHFVGGKECIETQTHYYDQPLGHFSAP